jgi:hypothetical protein
MFLTAPPQNVWKQEIDLRQFYKPNIIRLKKYALLEAYAHLHKSSTLWKSLENYLVSKKNIVHAIRVLQYANQIIERGEVYNFESANEYWTLLVHGHVEEKQENWDHYEQVYKPIIFGMIEDLKLYNPVRSNCQPFLPRYLEKFGQDSLVRDFAMHVGRFGDLLVVVNSESTPVTEHIPKQSTASVIKNGDLIGVTHAAMRTVPFDTVEIYEKIDGVMFMAIHDGVNWRFICPKVLSIHDYKQVANRHSRLNFNRITAPRDEPVLTIEQERNLIEKDFDDMETLITEIWNELGYDYSREKEFSFSFELCVPPGKIEKYRERSTRLGDLLSNRVVIHEKEKIVLHGAYKHGMYYPPNDFRHNWQVVKLVEIITINEEMHEKLQKRVDDMDPLVQEGYVVVNGIGECGKYVCSKFTELESRSQYHIWAEKLQRIYDRIVSECKTDKEYSERCKVLTLKHALFVIKKQQYSARHFLSLCDGKKLMNTVQSLQNFDEIKMQ